MHILHMNNIGKNLTHPTELGKLTEGAEQINETVETSQQDFGGDRRSGKAAKPTNLT